MALVGVNGQTQLFDYYFTKSTTWTPSFNCTALVNVIGGGGSGGAGDGGNPSGAPVIIMATGGGAGGHAISRLNFTSGVTYTLTIAAGGAEHALAENAKTNGNAGGNSSISGSDITTMTANGGAAGLCSEHDSMSSFSKAGGAGGTATGGNIANLTGGAGGAISGSAGSSGSGGYFATGGGALNLGKGAFAGGAVNCYVTASSTGRASGGGGTGGAGAYSNTASSVVQNQTTGGGGGVCAADDVTSGNGYSSINSNGLFPFINPSSFDHTDAQTVQMPFGQNMFSGQIGGQSLTAYTAYNGAGGAANQGSDASWSDFGGGGGLTRPSYNNRDSGGSYFGGGSGGIATQGFYGNYARRGGNGLIFIRILEI
jgi:hypothetical protein